MKLTIGKNFGAVGVMLFFGVCLAALGGWIFNIVKLIALLDGGVTAWVIVRAVGVFAAPLGAILGYF